MPDTVHVWEYGEAHDDLVVAFYLDEREYPSAEAAAAAVRAAHDAMARAGVIAEVEITSGASRREFAGSGVPTWEEFHRRHFVDGVPLPVRAPVPGRRPPHGWQAMHEELRRVQEELRAELTAAVTEAFPGARVEADARDPKRVSRASVDWSEERYGFTVWLTAYAGEVPPPAAVAALVPVLSRRGWDMGAARPSRLGLEVSGDRDGFAVGVLAYVGSVSVAGRSPLYRAPAEPGPAWLTEARPPDAGW